MSARHCGWCGVFIAATAEPIRFLNALGDPVVKGPLCPDCHRSACDLAGRNIRRPPCLSYFKSVRDEFGWPAELIA